MDKEFDSLKQQWDSLGEELEREPMVGTEVLRSVAEKYSAGTPVSTKGREGRSVVVPLWKIASAAACLVAAVVGVVFLLHRSSVYEGGVVAQQQEVRETVAAVTRQQPQRANRPRAIARYEVKAQIAEPVVSEKVDTLVEELLETEAVTVPTVPHNQFVAEVRQETAQPQVVCGDTSPVASDYIDVDNLIVYEDKKSWQEFDNSYNADRIDLVELFCTYIRDPLRQHFAKVQGEALLVCNQ